MFAPTVKNTDMFENHCGTIIFTAALSFFMAPAFPAGADSISDEAFEETKLMSSSDSIPLSIIYVSPAHGIRPKAVLQIVHGMCEHKERYIPFMKFMADNGYMCIIHDHRGHGSSVRDTSELGFFYEGGFSAMIEDIRIVTEWAENLCPGVPVILMGHSMGSMAVRSYTKRFDDRISALIVCGSPSWNAGSRIGKWLAARSMKKNGGLYRPEFIQKISFGAFNRKFKDEGSPNAWICSDPEIVEAYDNDPLCSFQFTSNGFYNLFSLMQDAYDEKGWQMKNPKLPVMFISGAEDPCLINERRFNKAVELMSKVGYSDVKAILYPGMRHEILNEKGKGEVWEDILAFCEETVSSDSYLRAI